MSYPKDLEEYDDRELREELLRRSRLRHEGKCSYCEQPIALRGIDEVKRCRLHEMSTGATGSFWTATRDWQQKQSSINLDIQIME